MKSINLKINSVEVKTEKRALRSKWTRELAKDLEVHQDIDMSSFEVYIAKQIRREIRMKSITKLFF